MYTGAPASRGARRLLSSAARTLRTADPVEVLGDYLDESLYAAARRRGLPAPARLRDPLLRADPAGSWRWT